MPSVLQAQQAPAFEIASIKPADPDRAMSISRSGNRLTFSNYSLEMLILWAYDIGSDRLLGRPSGLNSVRYDIVALAPVVAAPDGASVPGRFNRLMRSLLSERFKLVVHSETRELPHYAMVVDKNGPKVRMEELTGSASQNPFAMTSSGHLTGTKVSADMLAKVLTDQIGRAVEDQTALKGVFDFTLDWSPDTNVGIEGVDGSPAPSAGLRNGPSLFTALREQLGLRLDARKGQVEVVVIDHIETVPSQN